jgi:hypothetical protein
MEKNKKIIYLVNGTMCTIFLIFMTVKYVEYSGSKPDEDALARKALDSFFDKNNFSKGQATLKNNAVGDDGNNLDYYQSAKADYSFLDAKEEDKKEEQTNTIVEEVSLSKPPAPPKPKTKAQVVSTNSENIAFENPRETEPVAEKVEGKKDDTLSLRRRYRKAGVSVQTATSASTSVQTTSKLIRAYIDSDDKEYKNGQIVHIRNEEAFFVSGKEIPKNTLFYGKLSFSGYRANITITSFLLKGERIEATIQIYDKDSMPGLQSDKELTQEIADDAIEQGLRETTSRAGNVVVGGVGALAGGIAKKVKNQPTIRLSQGYNLYINIKTK